VKVILYFSDAFAWRYVEDGQWMPEWWDERRPLTTILGFSSTILPCLVSGRMPVETGIWTEYYRHDRPQSGLAKAIVSNPVTRVPVNLARLVAFRFARKAGMLAAHKLRIPLQLSHHFLRHDMDYKRFPPVQLPVPTLADLCRERGLRFGFRYLDHGYDDKAELARFERDLPSKDVLFLYDPSIDGHGHHAGADVNVLKPDMDRVERFLRRATELATQHDDEVHVLLFSDHGMTNVDRTYDIFAALKPFKLGTDYLVFVDSTFARFWYHRPGIREEIHRALAGAPASFLTEAERRSYGIDFADDRYGQEVFVADEGVVLHPSYISPSGFRTRLYPDRATHGYRPEAPTASGICFRRGAGADPSRTGPVHATDVFSIVDEITGGDPVGTVRRRRPGGAVSMKASDGGHAGLATAGLSGPGTPESLGPPS
jgi:hypothetical protein